MMRIAKLVLRTQATRGRVGGLLALGGLLVVISLAIRADDDLDRVGAMLDVTDGFGLAILAPVVALVFSSAALGDLVDDRTLVYVWLRPVPRWHITGGAMLASLAVALPVAVLPVVASVWIGQGGSDLIAGAALATALAVVAYSALFVGLGFKVRRALVWGLAYLLIWEGAVARTAEGAARLSVQTYARSALTELAGGKPPNGAVSLTAAVVVTGVVLAAAFVATTRWVTDAEVA